MAARPSGRAQSGQNGPGNPAVSAPHPRSAFRRPASASKGVASSTRQSHVLFLEVFQALLVGTDADELGPAELHGVSVRAINLQ